MKLIIIIVIVLLIMLAGVGLFVQNRVGRLSDKHDLVGSLDDEVKKLFKDQQSHAVAVGVFKNGRSHRKAYGVLSKNTTESPDAQTLFQIGSLTKVFTASLLQVLSNKELINIDATLEELIGGSTTLSDKAAKITLRQLATHTSGLPRVPEAMLAEVLSLAGEDNIMQDPYSYLTPADMFAYLATTKDAKAPGKFAYSNYGMGMLGHVLEILFDDSLENLFWVHLFQPLDMNRTGIVIPQRLDTAVAQGYDEKGAAAGLWHFSVLGGAGAVYSNVEDMLKFIQASLDVGSDASNRFETMRQPQYAGKSGLGWMQPGFFEKFFGNKNFYWHNGMVGGYSSYMAISPVDNAGIVVLTSSAIDPTMLGIMLARQLRTQSFAD